ncbi:MAG: hypothetical protein AVDCRST_MAG07-1190, partial [uncultured Frankineae bacterium]
GSHDVRTADGGRRLAGDVRLRLGQPAVGRPGDGDGRAGRAPVLGAGGRAAAQAGGEGRRRVGAARRRPPALGGGAGRVPGAGRAARPAPPVGL